MSNTKVWGVTKGSIDCMNSPSCAFQEEVRDISSISPLHRREVESWTEKKMFRSFPLHCQMGQSLLFQLYVPRFGSDKGRPLQLITNKSFHVYQKDNLFFCFSPVDHREINSVERTKKWTSLSNLASIRGIAFEEREKRKREKVDRPAS